MKRSLVYIIAAMVAVIVAGFVGIKLIKTQEMAVSTFMPVATATPTIEIVVAAKGIDAGELISSDALTTMSVDINDPRAGSAYVSFSQCVGKRAKMSISKGQPIYDSMLNLTLQAKEDLAYRVPEGMVALPIDTDALNGVEGYLKAGDTVDILCSAAALRSALDFSAYMDAVKKGADFSTREIIYLAKNVTILEVGDIAYSEGYAAQEANRELEVDGEPAPETVTTFYSCVILCVDEELARTIVQIREVDSENKLTLTLKHRGYEGADAEADSGVSYEDILGTDLETFINNASAQKPGANSQTNGGNTNSNTPAPEETQQPGSTLDYEGITDIIAG